MTTITDNTLAPSPLSTTNTGKAATAAGADTISATQDRFMKLLITQMKNQDPMNPLDNAQVTSQLAQLSTVSGIDKLNATMGTLKDSFQSGQALQATALIGHGVLVPGNTTSLTDGKAVLGMDLPGAADTVTVTIRDASGASVRKIELGAQAAGTLPVAWDGKTDRGTTAANGQYSFDVKATSAGAAVKTTTLTFDQVGSVSTGAGGTKLNLTGGNSVALADVREII